MSNAAVAAPGASAADLKGIMRVLAILAVGMGTFLITLDQFIVNVSISTLAGELGVSNNNAAWSITAYTTASAAVIPLTGRLTTLVGRVRLFAISTFAFSIASFLCGTADSLGELILFRVLQGAAGGPIIPLSQALLLFLFSKRTSAALGVFGMLVMIGPVAGPVLGGWITFDYGWRPIFYINVPIGIVVSVVTLALLSRFESKREPIKFDKMGLLLLFGWVFAYQVMMNKGYDWAWFEDWRIRMLGCSALVAFTFFLIWEWFHPRAAVPLHFFKSANFCVALIIMTPYMAIVFANLVLGPIWVQQVLGYNQVWAGLTLAPLGVTAVPVFPLIGHYMPKLDVRIWVLIALVITAISFFWMAYSPIDVDFRTMAYQRMLMGIGFAIIYPPLMALAISDIPEEEMPSGAGVYSFARMMGLGFGVAYGVNYYSTREVFFQQRYGSWVIPSNEAFSGYVASLKELGFAGKQIDAMLYEMVQNQAFTESYLQTCYISGVILVASIFFLLFVKKMESAQT